MIDYLISYLEKVNIKLNEVQKQQFITYFELLTLWNEKINLTAITEPQEVALKHFYDSITFLLNVDVEKGARVIDVGTGAGFPGIPLKIMRPDINLTLLDSLNKRINFLNTVCTRLDLQAQLINRRAEEGGRDKNLRERFDIATSRAVANMNVLCEYCMPYVKLRGKFVAMKGKTGREELNNARGAIKTLSGKVLTCREFNLPNGDERTIVVVEKNDKTPKQFPRQYAKIKSKPLN